MARVIGTVDGAICEGPLSVFNRLFVGTRSQALSGAVEIRGAVDPYVWVEGIIARYLNHAYGNGSNTLPWMLYYRSRGTRELPTTVQNGDTLGIVAFAGNPADPFSPGPNQVTFIATENYAAGAQGARCNINVVPNGSVVSATAISAFASVAADDVRMQVFDVTAAALKQVSRGIADSGGVGFRLLRIPN